MQWSFAATRYWLGFILLFLVCFYALQQLAGVSMVRVQLTSSQETTFKIYWQTQADGGWTETNSSSVRLNAHKKNYVLLLPVPTHVINKLRVDPSDRADVNTRIFKISVHSLYTRTLEFGALDNDQLSRFTPIKHTTVSEIGNVLESTSTGNDSGFIVDLPELTAQPEPILRITQSLLLSALLFGLIIVFPKLSKDLNWVPLGLLLVTGAVLAMATLSNVNTHPDELTHIRNAQYYANNYIPPKVCSAEALNTYSVYGVSRLDKREIAYYVGGRYLQLVEFIPALAYTKLRYLNVALFFIMVLLTFRQPNARFLFLPLLLTPQAWYLFSYYNSDALSLFAVMMTAYQVFIPQSILRRLLNGERPPGYLLGVLALSILFAMQYWLKLNYLIYPIFLLMLSASWWLLKRRLPTMQFAAPLVLAFGLGTALFLGWEGSRHAVNDFDLAQRVHDCRELTAHLEYKPSTPLDETQRSIKLRAKGVSLEEMFDEYKWAKQIIYTGQGAYGYMNYLSEDAHYRIVSTFIALFFLYIVTMILVRGDGMARMVVFSTLTAIAGITVAAIINSWFNSFQPQGRYLLVYLPLLGSLIVMYANKLNVIWLSFLAGIPFLLGLYSFFAVGLIEIPKYSF
jgi:hypothetical protein